MRDGTDFFSLLAAIGGRAELFSAGGNLARKAVNEIVRAQLVAEGMTLETLRALHALLGPAAFAEALDGVPAPKTRPLLARIDPNAPALAQPGDRVKALLALAAGTQAPAPAPEKPARKPAARKGAKEAVGKETAGKETAGKEVVGKEAPKAPAGSAGEGAPSATPAASPAAAPRKRKITGRAALRVSEER